jgi:hypothetical protein
VSCSALRLLRIGLLTLAGAALSAGCAPSNGAVAIYLPTRLGPDGPPGQRSPVLTTVERQQRHGMSQARQVVLDVFVGPSLQERGRGFLETIPLTTRLLDVRVDRDAATVDLGGTAPNFVGAAAIVYSLTGLPGVTRVRLLLDGRPCCVLTHQGRPVSPLSRVTFRSWSGEPCELRTRPTQVACRGG